MANSGKLSICYISFRSRFNATEEIQPYESGRKKGAIAPKGVAPKPLAIAL
ncbi:hypothetical protein [Geitlerinema sp. P-1104]|uniref:hypothetical protein n=1 Tax=Geitlerinema sp. P-1104 TaxID=2546230 RepID=UPI0014775880|nr:hypothetical protein [Geitlerinema sp. P-1104]